MGRTPRPTQPQAHERHEREDPAAHRGGGAGDAGDAAVEGGRGRLGGRSTNAPVIPPPTPDTGGADREQGISPQGHGSAATPAAPAHPHEDWSQVQRDAWREWFTQQLLATGFAAPRRGRVAFWITDLSEATGIHKNTLLNYVKIGAQPRPTQVAALARALGLHPLTVAYRAGHLNREELLQLVGGGSIPSPEDMRAALVELDYLPSTPSMAHMKETLRATTEYTLHMVESLSAQLGLSPEEFGPVAAETVKREIVADRTPFTTPAPSQQGQRQPRYPGPTRSRQPRAGVDDAPDDL